MQKFLYFLVLAIGSSASAGTSQYEIKMELSINGRQVFSPSLIAKEGEAATIKQKTNHEESFIEVIATEGSVQGKKGIELKFVVGLIDQEGKRTIVSKPQILVRENEKAQISVGEVDKKEQMSLSVIAKRKLM